MSESLPDKGGLSTNVNLRGKVADDGGFKPFFGDTAIFSLDDADVAWLSRIQDALYKSCGNIFAERIEPATFHITLHDLSASPTAPPSDVEKNAPRAVELIENARRRYPNGLYITSRRAFSMVDTSVVMGFEPKTNEDSLALTGLYEEFQSVVPLTYPLTLHATLAYYKPGEYGDDALAALRSVFNAVGSEPRELRLDLEKLNYATFRSMNDYSIRP